MYLYVCMYIYIHISIHRHTHIVDVAQRLPRQLLEETERGRQRRVQVVHEKQQVIEAIVHNERPASRRQGRK